MKFGYASFLCFVINILYENVTSFEFPNIPHYASIQQLLHNVHFPSCTLYIPLESARESKWSNVFPHENWETNCKTCTFLYFDLSFYEKLIRIATHGKMFDSVKHTSTCTIYFAYRTKNIKLEPAETVDITKTIFPKFVRSIADLGKSLQRKVTPDFVLSFVSLPKFITKPSKFLPIYVLLPSVMHSSLLIVLVINEPEFATNTHSLCLEGCLTCDKFIKQLKKEKPDKISRLMILVPVNSFPVHFSVQSQKRLQEKISDFGNWTFAQDQNTIHDIGKMLKNSSQIYPTLDDIVVDTFIRQQNSSLCVRSFLRGALVYTVAHDFLVNVGTFENHILRYPLAAGASVEGIRFSVILSLEDGQTGRLLGSSGSLFSTMRFRSWLVLSLVLICVALVLRIGSGNSNSQWIFWLLAVLLEQGDGRLRKLRSNKTANLLCAWMFGTFILRNHFSSTLYSLMTKAPAPEKVPKTLDQLLQASVNEAKTFPLLLDDKLMAQLQYKLRHFLSGSATETLSRNQHLEKYLTMLGRLQSVNVGQNTVQYLQNISTGTPVNCGMYGSRARYGSDVKEESCSTTGRFALLHQISGQRNTMRDEITRFFKSVIVLFTSRKIFSLMNEPAFLTEPVLWGVKKKYVFMHSFAKMVAQLTESGIYAKYAEVHDYVKLKLILKNLSSVLNRPVRLRTNLAVTAQGLDHEEHLVTFDNFIAILLVYFYLISYCMIVIFCEVFYKIYFRNSISKIFRC